MPNPLLSIERISKRFGTTEVLSDITLTVDEGEFLTVLGESGSGKTTLLRIIAGFEQANSGVLIMRGTALGNLPPERRNVNTVFQSYALFPHLNVSENVAYGLRARRVPPGERQTRVEVALKQVHMLGFGDRRPSQLSGGQQQRVALARALVNRPALLLLDEPLSALDATLRGDMQRELKSLQRDTGIAFVLVTHDQEEAMTLSDRIAVLRNGRLEQVDTPRIVYNSPRTAYIAEFIGRANLLPNGLAVRPENIQILSPGAISPPDCRRWTGTIRQRVFVGASELLEIECQDGLTLRVRTSGAHPHAEEVQLIVNPEHLIDLS